MCVDDGDRPVYGFKRPPIYCSDGVFDKTPVIDGFNRSSHVLDKAIRQFVLHRLSEYTR